jgi:hypothetical protein
MLQGHIVKVAHTHACMHMLGHLITNGIIVFKLLILFLQISLIKFRKKFTKKKVNFKLDKRKISAFLFKILTQFSLEKHWVCDNHYFYLCRPIELLNETC